MPADSGGARRQAHTYKKVLSIQDQETPPCPTRTPSLPAERERHVSRRNHDWQQGWTISTTDAVTHQVASTAATSAAKALQDFIDLLFRE
jgi:hypothetical protein